MKDEVVGQFNVRFIRVVQYPTYIANVVPVPKFRENIRMCIDYWDLNKALPKDDYPLPNINMMIDNTEIITSSHFWMDSPNIIILSCIPITKTRLISSPHVKPFVVMSFLLVSRMEGLHTIDHPQLSCIISYKEVEVYVDSIIIKSNTRESYIPSLRKIFIDYDNINYPSIHKNASLVS